MSQYRVKIEGQVHDWHCDEPFGAELFGDRIDGLMRLHIEDTIGIGYSDLKVIITEDGFSEEPNRVGHIGCMIYGVDISFDLDLSLYEFNGGYGGGLSWEILSPAFYLHPWQGMEWPNKSMFETPYNYIELKDRYPHINEIIVINQVVKFLLEYSLQDYDGNIFDYWEELGINITPIDRYGGLEYFMNWFDDNPFEVKQ
jgi:hypothetical protein